MADNPLVCAHHFNLRDAMSKIIKPRLILIF